jgi:hypothetical protein
LRRQRALQREHLAWLEREIAALEGAVPPELSAASPPPLGSTAGQPDAEAILEEYRQPAVSITRRTKAGCLIYFAAGMGLLALLLALLYVAARARRGH